MDGLKVFSGSSHPALAQAICKCLGIAPGRLSTTRFSNENLKVRIEENVREQDVFVVQTSAPPLSENIAKGFRTPQQVMDGWMRSKEHKANILNCNAKAIGVGLAVTKDGTAYWTQDFGRQ